VDDRISGSYAEYDSFSYEHTAELLAAKFGDAANVWIVRPSRFHFGAFACFDGFVDTNTVGAVQSYPSNGSAVEQLASLMESVREILEQDPGQDQGAFSLKNCSEDNPIIIRWTQLIVYYGCVVRISTLLPVHLVGFSKGGVVLNQIATEIATRWHEEDLNSSINTAGEANQDEELHTQTETMGVSPSHASLCRPLASMVASIHWLDSGNGSKRGAVPVDQETLVGLSQLRSLQLCVHVTPYQFESKERPWVKNEVLHLVTTLTRLGANVAFMKYAEDEPATLASHFQILRDFQVPCGKWKTGRPDSPEIPLTPMVIQTCV
jgi:hypothetical protein